MYKIFLILLVGLVFGFSIAAGQDKTDNLSKTDSIRQTNYSESTPYKPREIELTAIEKKREKKLRKDLDKKKTIQPASEVSSKITDNNKTIRIPVFVHDRKGTPVTDLKNSDIKLFVDDKEREISAFESAKPPLNILLVVDTSPSLAYKDKDLRNVVSEMIKALRPDDKLQIMKFNEELVVLTEPTNDSQILQKAVKKFEMGDGTSIYDTVQTIFNKYLSANNEKPVIILLTDGIDTTSKKAHYKESLLEAEKNGAIVFPLYFDSYEYFQKNKSGYLVSGLSNNVPVSLGTGKAESELGKAYLQDIALLSGGKTFAIKHFSEIKKEDFEAVFKFINPQYYISLNSTETVNTFQRRQIKVRVNRPNLTVQARGSYVLGVD